MLKDWLWALAITLGVWLEVAGWTRLFTRTFFPRLETTRRKASLLIPLGFAAASQGYFLLSLTGRGTPSVHVALFVVGIALLFLPRLKRAQHTDGLEHHQLHLKLARTFSLMTWRRSWPWLALPIFWFILRLIDGLLPHDNGEALAIHLPASRQWLENGKQVLDPLQPFGGATGIWDALYYHIQAIMQAIGPVHRTALLRAQLASQLLHFTAGQVLTIACLAKVLEPSIRTRWDGLIHKRSSAERRHQLGMASTVAIPASLFFAWLGAAQSQFNGTLALTGWGASMFTAASLSFVIEGHFVAATWLACSAIAVMLSAWTLCVALLAATCVVFFFLYERGRKRLFLFRKRPFERIAVYALTILGATGPIFWRNWSQTGSLLQPGAEWASTAPLPAHAAEYTILASALVVFGLLALGYSLWSTRTQRSMGYSLGPFLAFTLVSIVTTRLIHTPLDALASAALVSAGALGIEFAIIESKAAPLASWLPQAWFALGLFAVPMPFHVLWQNLPYAFRPSETYLAQYHKQFVAKRWADAHLPKTARIAFTSDDEFYYLEQSAASIRSSRILRESLARAALPTNRVHVLCETGFNVLAWEERAHGSETAGLALWLKLSKAPVLHSTDDVTFFELRCPD